MKKPPWFKFFTTDWRNSRRVRRMTPAQKGVYVDLLAWAWEEGGIPNDICEIANELRLSRKVLEPLFLAIADTFSPSSDPNILVNDYQEALRSEVLAKSKKAAKSATSRWNHNDHAIEPTDAFPELSQCDRIDDASDSHSYARLALSSASSLQEPLALPQHDARRSDLLPLSASGSTDREAIQWPDLGKPDSVKQRRLVDAHQGEARMVLDALNAARRRINPASTGIRASYTSLSGISARLEAGKTLEECMRVVALGEKECRREPSSLKWFDAVSPWRPENFERRVAHVDGDALALRQGTAPKPRTTEYADLAESIHGRRITGDSE